MEVYPFITFKVFSYSLFYHPLAPRQIRPFAYDNNCQHLSDCIKKGNFASEKLESICWDPYRGGGNTICLCASLFFTYPKVPFWAVCLIWLINLVVTGWVGVLCLSSRVTPNLSKARSKYVFSWPVITPKNWHPGIRSSSVGALATIDASNITKESRKRWSWIRYLFNTARSIFPDASSAVNRWEITRCHWSPAASRSSSVNLLGSNDASAAVLLIEEDIDSNTCDFKNTQTKWA